MKVVILDKKLKKNLAMFKHLIERQAKKREKFFQTIRKSYMAYVNTHTGEIRFQELQPGEYASADWKPIVLRLSVDPEGAFEVFSPDNNESFDYKALNKEAYSLFTLTLHVLNQLSYDPINGTNPFWILRQIAQLDFLLAEQEEGKRNKIYEAWHNVDRMTAEKILATSSPGTYLFRKDEYAKLLEEKLNAECAEPVFCLTLTFRNYEEKISEKTVVNKGGKWLFYHDDDLKLTGPSFEDISNLLNSEEDVALVKPLLT